MAFSLSSPSLRQIPISIAGSEVPVFLLDGTAFIVRATPTTKVEAVVISISAHLGIEANAHYGLFVRTPENDLAPVDNSTTLARVLAQWYDQASYLSGECHGWICR